MFAIRSNILLMRARLTVSPLKLLARCHNAQNLAMLLNHFNKRIYFKFNLAYRLCISNPVLEKVPWPDNAAEGQEDEAFEGDS